MEQPRQRAGSAVREKASAPLPEWDLSDLYAAPDAPEVRADLERADQAATALADDFKGRLGELSGDDLASLIARYEQIEEWLGRAASYAQLLHAANTEDPKIGRFFQTVQERATAIGTKILFVTLELNRIEDQALEAALAASVKLAHYRPWIRDLRNFRPHQLDDAIEQVLHEKAITGRRAWTRLFDETMAGLRFPHDDPSSMVGMNRDLIRWRWHRPMSLAGHPLRRAERFGRGGNLLLVSLASRESEPMKYRLS
jgi:oligoendopeptidase F